MMSESRPTGTESKFVLESRETLPTSSTTHLTGVRSGGESVNGRMGAVTV
jgi:hypothetical protein